MADYIMDFGDTSNLRSVSPLKEFDLHGIIISIRLYYNSIDSSIYMNIYDVDDNVISNGIKLVPNIDFIEKISYKFKSEFQMYVMSTTKDGLHKDVTVENFGKEMVMWYVRKDV
ncbi:MAG: phage baseplate plug family protein [Paraclostridium sp.]